MRRPPFPAALLGRAPAAPPAAAVPRGRSGDAVERPRLAATACGDRDGRRCRWGGRCAHPDPTELLPIVGQARAPPRRGGAWRRGGPRCIH